MTPTLLSVLWKALIEKQGGELTKALDLSSLAKISDGYTAGHMVQVIQTVITKRRILQQARKPLTAAEFVGPLAKIDPVFKEEEEALKVHSQIELVSFFNIIIIKVAHAGIHSNDFFPSLPLFLSLFPSSLPELVYKDPSGKEED